VEHCVSEIKIKPEMTLQEFYVCERALRYGKGEMAALWTILAAGAVFLASSAALTWGTPASILAGLALILVTFNVYYNGYRAAVRRGRAHKRYRESNITYIFTDERIVATATYAKSSLSWAAVDGVIELRTLYLLTVGSSCIGVPKRNIPLHSLDDFIQLLKTHGLLKQT
jgi:hypothetical protein